MEYLLVHLKPTQRTTKIQMKGPCQAISLNGKNCGNFSTRQNFEVALIVKFQLEPFDFSVFRGLRKPCHMSTFDNFSFRVSCT